MNGWFRVPPWCMSVHDEPSAERARAWVYLLGAWHNGDSPSVREFRRVTGFGQGRADALYRDVLQWAEENGARYPLNARQGAEQKRSRSGAEAEQAKLVETRTYEPQRSRSGAEPEQERSISRARVPFVEREEREERGDHAREETRMVPDDLAALLGEAVFSRPARALAIAGVTPEVLVRMTHHELRMTPGVGGSWRVIAEACERAGWQLEEGGPELRNGAFHRPQATRPQPAPAFDWQALLDEEGA